MLAAGFLMACSRRLVPLADRGLGVFAPEDALLLQQRHDVLDELLQVVRKAAEPHDESVGGPADEPLLQVVGYLLGRADHRAVAAGSPAAPAVGDQLADRAVSVVLKEQPDGTVEA